jgi:hypothetical protein
MAENELTTTTISVDEQVWTLLNSKKRPGCRDSMNAVLRREFGLDKQKTRKKHS